MTESAAKKLTVKIFRVILEEFNGYEADEIIKKKLAEECEASQEFQRIKNLIKKQIKSK